MEIIKIMAAWKRWIRGPPPAATVGGGKSAVSRRQQETVWTKVTEGCLRVRPHHTTRRGLKTPQRTTHRSHPPVISRSIHIKGFFSRRTLPLWITSFLTAHKPHRRSRWTPVCADTALLDAEHTLLALCDGLRSKEVILGTRSWVEGCTDAPAPSTHPS